MILFNFSAIIATLLAMACLGLWSNILTHSSGRATYDFRSDYAIGFLFSCLGAGLTFGTFGATQPLLENASRAASPNGLYALAGGAIFYVGVLLLLRSITNAGLTLAFPVAFGAGTITAAICELQSSSEAIPIAHFALPLAAAATAMFAYSPRLKSATNRLSLLFAGLAGGFVAIGLITALRSMEGPRSLNSYSASSAFAVGLFVCAQLEQLLFRMSAPHPTKGFEKLPKAGIVAGVVCGIGISLAVITSAAMPGKSSEIYFTLSGAVVVGVASGLFIQKEATIGRYRYQVATLALLISNLGLVILYH